ncbi:unnamed protein product [Chrysoparadoxa australica]
MNSFPRALHPFSLSQMKFLDLALSIPAAAGRECDLVAMLRSFCQPELVDCVDCWGCTVKKVQEEIEQLERLDSGTFGEHVKRLQESLDTLHKSGEVPRDMVTAQRSLCVKSLQLSRLPVVLCLHIRRQGYCPASDRMVKLHQHVTFPLQLVITQVMQLQCLILSSSPHHCPCSLLHITSIFMPHIPHMPHSLCQPVTLWSCIDPATAPPLSSGGLLWVTYDLTHYLAAGSVQLCVG